MSMTREQAWDLLTQYNQEEFHLRHAVTVEHVMRWFARELGYGYAAVLGSTEYYARFGYAAAGRHGIQAPPEIPPENFMAIRLREDAGPMEGTIVYAQEFGI